MFVVVYFLASGIASAQGCYESPIVSPRPFMGNDGEIFKLSDDSIWEVKDEDEYLYEYYPDVIICPSRNQLAINGKTLNVQQGGAPKTEDSENSESEESSPTFIESQIEGDFEGWEGDTIVKLINGQIWQQTEYYYHYLYAFMPQVVVYRSDSGFKMKVEGIEKSIGVSQISR